MKNETRCRLTSDDIINHFLQISGKLIRLVRKLFTPIKIESLWKNAAIAVPRVIIGLMILSGIWHIDMGLPPEVYHETLQQNFTSLEDIEWLDTGLLKWFDSLGLLTMGGMMLAGFNTRLTALSILWTLSEGLIVNGIIPFTSYTTFGVFVFVAGYSLILGSGKLGIDYWLLRRMRQKQSKKEKTRID
ncbi:hypothetical protein [Rhodohalobacter mucosus]|uniref:DoxX family protein n=1 Tax=Rhodohalobacter mucosus TaxID=2079485 RepID=A0A316TUK2_9BACT|nr:hypothetical protein [Rhodohalobacter mucosus]PWN07381.1 hypothetical protein DDZ15_03705 [Rhodohalobacter mucosus]